VTGFALSARTSRAALKEAVAYLKTKDLDTPVLDARLIVQHALGADWEALFIGADRPLGEAERAALVRGIARRAAHEPVSRIVGRRHFWTLDLAVSPATLDPRADTESLVEAVVAAIPDRARPLRILDLGTGTGALLLALLSEYKNATGIGVDISPEAAETAQANALSHGLGERALIRVGDWTAGLTGPFDVVVSNPPYIPAADIAALPLEVREHDPRSALDGGPDGLDAYRRILPAIPPILAPDGLVVLEIGAGQGDLVAALGAANGLFERGRRRDLAGIERALVLRPAEPSMGAWEQRR
jgi:release factor glutamine methyltransferase